MFIWDRILCFAFGSLMFGGYKWNTAEFHVSEGHLCRFFKSMTRMSPVEYINFYRISMSMELLRQTDMEISEISMRTGFNNISYYNRTFRKYMHMTPSQYRETSGFSC